MSVEQDKIREELKERIGALPYRTMEAIPKRSENLLWVIAELLIEIKDKLATGAVEVYGSVTVDGDVTVHEPR